MESSTLKQIERPGEYDKHFLASIDSNHVYDKNCDIAL